MGFLDTLFGRTKPVQPKLDDLFGLPSAAVQLEAATGFKPTGSGSVSFRAPEGKPFVSPGTYGDLVLRGVSVEY